MIGASRLLKKGKDEEQTGLQVFQGAQKAKLITPKLRLKTAETTNHTLKMGGKKWNYKDGFFLCRC